MPRTLLGLSRCEPSSAADSHGPAGGRHQYQLRPGPGPARRRAVHEIIGDRAYGTDPAQVVALARAVAEGHLAGGVLPVVKHVPGHGRAAADSHLELPVVTATREDLEATDFEPFRRLANLPAAMTAHVVFSAFDADQPASTSPGIVKNVIRGAIGFDGLLISDDLGMKALTGSIAERALAVLTAGSDLALLCSGNLAETESVASVAPALVGASRQRFERACAVFGQQRPFDVAEAEPALRCGCAPRPESV